MEKGIVSQARALLNPCRVCPRHCKVNRLANELGFCKSGALARVASAGAHFGEESALVGKGGSGAIFFTGCNLQCAFCQNFSIGHATGGFDMEPEDLAELMVSLQRKKCVNINLVTPSHIAPQLLEAIILARRGGLSVPVVYNCGGYESVEMLRLLDGYVDIYLPDFKYADAASAEKYSSAPDYPQVAQAAIAEMFRQVGVLRLNAEGLATRGLLVRHLIMPIDVAQSRQVIDLVAQAAPGCAINVMGQYRPSYRACEYPELLEFPREKVVGELRQYAASLQLMRVD